MNRLLIASILALVSWGVSAQAWTTSDQSFERVFQSSKTYELVNSEWLRTSYPQKVIQIIYNVSVPSENLFGFVMLNQSGREDWFYGFESSTCFTDGDVLVGGLYVRTDNMEDSSLWMWVDEVTVVIDVDIQTHIHGDFRIDYLKRND